MNQKIIAGVFAIVMSFAAGSATAGPDWALIEKAREAKKAEQQKAAELAAASKRLTVAQGASQDTAAKTSGN